MKRFSLIPLLIAFILLSSSSIYCQTYEIRGSLREWIQVFTQSPNEIDLAQTRLKLELLSTLGEFTAFKVRSYFIYDGVRKNHEWEFQEAFIDYYSDLFDVRFGRQVIAWGKADELNPTDILNPQNLIVLQEEKSIRKIGLMQLNTEWKIDDLILQGIWKLEFNNMMLPPLDSRWAFFTIPGLNELPEPEYPGNRLQDTEWAFKLSHTISLFDFSISYFDGWDNIATAIFIFNPEMQQLELDKLKFFRTKMIGADFAGSIASFGVWGEAAYFITEKSDNPVVKNPYLQFVLGADYTFDYSITVNLQYYQEINETEADEEIPSKLGLGIPLQQALSFRIEKKFGEIESHSIELFGIYDIKYQGLLLQPKLILSPEDVIEIEVGMALYAGKEESIFGRFETNNLVYLKGTFSF